MYARALATRLKSRQRLVDVILTQVGEHDLHSRVDKTPGKAEPDAARASGDKGCFSVDLFHVTPPRPRQLQAPLQTKYKRPVTRTSAGSPLRALLQPRTGDFARSSWRSSASCAGHPATSP